MGFIKHYFPGGNTDQGFVNFFGEIIAPWEKDYRVYILKGGPGVGKNTFMKQLGTWAAVQGKNIELFHCSGDAESLDAVKIIENKIVMLDGTAPHVIEPIVPGVVEQIINLGEYLDETRLLQNTATIKELTAENTRCFQYVFGYLAAAGRVTAISNSLYRQAIDYSKLRQIAREIIERFSIATETTSKFQSRQLFAAANTPQGIVDYFGTILFDERLIRLNGSKFVASELLLSIIEECRALRYRCQIFVSPLQSQLPEHLIINDLNLCISTSETAETEEDFEVVEVDACLKPELLSTSIAKREFNGIEVDALYQAGLLELKNAKKIHDSLEEFYQKSMDFDALNSYINDFISEIDNVG